MAVSVGRCSLSLWNVCWCVFEIEDVGEIKKRKVGCRETQKKKERKTEFEGDRDEDREADCPSEDCQTFRTAEVCISASLILL